MAPLTCWNLNSTPFWVRLPILTSLAGGFFFPAKIPAVKFQLFKHSSARIYHSFSIRGHLFLINELLLLK